jgi:SpoVK/Ycf46/Vps4 family AAA+-type ATPase
MDIKVDRIGRKPLTAQGNGHGAGSGGVDATGVLDSRKLPDDEYLRLWDAVIIDESQKDRLLSQAVVNFTVRPKVDKARVPFHGLILLHGPPGTGKTSLAKGLAARTAQALKSIGSFTFIEVEPHALASAALGKSQKAVRDLLGGTIAEHASNGPLIVLLDEVETLAPDRAKLSLQANPVDVHRATDAVLMQLDQLAAQFNHLLFIATSNFTDAIDAALLSRADLIECIGLPNQAAIEKILRDSLSAFAEQFDAVEVLVKHKDIAKIAEQCLGLDARAVRKLVIAACTSDKKVAMNPATMTINHVHDAVKRAKGRLLEKSK